MLALYSASACAHQLSESFLHRWLLAKSSFKSGKQNLEAMMLHQTSCSAMPKVTVVMETLANQSLDLGYFFTIRTSL